MHAIRQGMIWLIPCLMLSSLALFVACIAEFYIGGRPSWVQAFYDMNSAVGDVFPYLMTATTSYLLAMQWRIPRPPMALLSILYLVVSASLIKTHSTLEMLYIVMAIVTPLYAIPLIAYLFSLKALHVTSSESAGSMVKESLNLVLPAIITLAMVMLVNFVILESLSLFSLDKLLTFDYANDPYIFGSVFAVLNSTLWFFGIHGYYALLPMVELLQQASDLTYSTVAAGGSAPYAMNLSFMGTFVFIGGCGSTLSLVIALLLFSKQKTLRLIAIASIPIGLINVNEILLFGLPIIFNPRLFIPFLLAPLANVIIGLTAVNLGLVQIPSVSVPFNAPVLVNALIATHGDWHSVALQAINLAVGILIYLPAVRATNQVFGEREIRIASLDTTYMRREEEAKTLADDPIVLAQQKEHHQARVEKQIQNMSQKEFCLEYQPQVAKHNGAVVGCEALVRAMDDQGNLLPPSSFLPWLESAGLMKDMDLWVFKRVAKDIVYWNQLGIHVPVSVNITPDTLVDDEYLGKIISAIGAVSSQIHIEITEETLLVDERALQCALERLHAMKVKIYIDDFGTGYSSLSYLNRFDIDAIKIDRSFVLALDTQRGRKVFASLQSVATELDLAVVVEGVETQQQLDAIADHPNLSIQGWLFSRSLKPEDFINYVQASPSITQAQRVS
ncbi:PTS sugar transporter subunit IIC/EAL domain-containing protein [Vibrio sp. Y2-5]|uniref:PTS sugar transporter subunit IIC/EAL domain-containing protein n=1 Tax=Vibrio sp. Y2-5 TaxID=2743977 RepID=UPI001660FF79|nr:PTS sugar transporter subunit IIC/EAL domain-containing protein [Vibrio sp. Y2-5]